jgi:O-antigen/teichoic acid export membrane protein
MHLAKKIAWNTIIQFASKIISIIFGLFTIAIITRYLGQAGFGEYTIVNTFISFFAVAADLGLTLITVQMISQPNINRDQVLSDLFSLRFWSAIFLLILAPITILFFPYSSAIKIGVLVTVVSYFFVALNQIMVGLFQKELRLDRVAIGEVLSRASLLGGILLAAVLNWGLLGILWVAVIASFLNFLILFIYARKLAHIRLNFHWPVWLAIVKKSWPIGLTIIFNLIYLRADTIFLSIFKSQNAVGLYGAAYRVVDVLITLPFIFAGIVLPIMTSSWLEKRELQFQNVLQRSFDLMSIIAVPMVFGAYCLADTIMSTVAGEDFVLSGSILKILIIASSIIYLGTVFSHAVIAIDKQKAIIWAYLFVALTALAGYLFFIPSFSYFGAAWVTVYSELTIALASFYIVWKNTRFIPNVTVFLKSLLASIAMALVLWPISKISLAITLPLGVIVYLLVLYITKGVSKKDILELIDKS